MDNMNNASRRRPRAFARVSSAIFICVLAASSCGRATPDNKASSTSPGSTIYGSFDVGGHKLELNCQGSGSPTVVYLHGFISDPSGGGAQNSGEIPGLLNKRYRVCIYDRANVGLSRLGGVVAGPLTGKDSVHDLHALLEAAKVPGPYVLLGASFGGLIADMYASTYPDDVVGMVLLDASLPQDTRIDDRFLPKSERLQADDWKTTTEPIDQLTTYHQAQVMEGNEPNVPLTYIATTQIDLPPSFPVKAMTAAIRAGQRRFVERFSTGRLIFLDVPHFMEPVIPDRIAQEVERVIEAG